MGGGWVTDEKGCPGPPDPPPSGHAYGLNSTCDSSVVDKGYSVAHIMSNLHLCKIIFNGIRVHLTSFGVHWPFITALTVKNRSEPV